MKATINQLWETGRNVISFDDDEFNHPAYISELKKCDNVLLGDKIKGTKMQEVMIDDYIYLVEPISMMHPLGGTIKLLEV